jgi:hypothetical protein
MGFDVNKLHAEICGDGVFYTFAGNIASIQINSILEGVEEKLIEASTSLKVRKKILNIMVESLQNLFHHSDIVPEDLVETLGKRYEMVVITRKADDFLLTVGNFVLTDKVKFLTEKIEKINSLSEAELKEMYKSILNYQKLSSKGGGGLGLIDMARKSDKKLEYKFYPHDEKYYFYRLDIFVSNL